MKHGSLYLLALSVKDRTVPDRYLGRQIGKYRVIRLLGAGAFAWVYEAVDRDLEIPVALKILRPEFAGQSDAEARFRREASTAARLRHPNIVTVRDVGQVDSASFVAMDLLPLSLARRLELLTRLPEPDVVRLGLDVAAALAVAHAGGVVHRDIKPDNILIGTQGEAVVADFGLARALDGGGATLSGSHHVMGTPHYFSPEQARGLELDGRSDLYALGVTLFRASTGRLPYEGDDWYAVARLHVEAPIPDVQPLVADLTDGFAAIVRRLLQKAPADRFATALEVADALASLSTAPMTRALATASRSPATTVAAMPPIALTNTSRTNRVAVWGAVAAGVAVLAVAALLLRPDQSPFTGNTPSAGQAPATPGLLPVSPADTAMRGGDTARRDLVRSDTSGVRAPAPAATPTNAPSRAALAAAARSRLSISVNDSASIYVDGVLIGRANGVVERPGGARLLVKAVVADAPVSCVTARQDTVIRLDPGERTALSLPVRSCVGLSFDVEPVDAIVRFESTDGGRTVEVRADSTSAVLLPTGRYRLKVSAARCSPYLEDSLVVTRSATREPLFKRVRLPCGMSGPQ
jgi:serine/threonine protein kinase